MSLADQKNAMKKGSAAGQSDYIFADREAEQQRLERQAGSGAGDVAMLAARLVGSDGEVIGVERDPAAVASATARAERAGFSNVHFVQGDAQTLHGIEGSEDLDDNQASGRCWQARS